MDGNFSLNFGTDMCNRFLKIMVLLYADDTVLLADRKEGLQKALHSLEKYCMYSKLKVNVSKTEVMIFGKRKHKKNG